MDLVDFHGTLAKDGPGYDREEDRPPVKPMVRKVKRWLREGKKVKILTAAARSKERARQIANWTEEHIGKRLPVTNVKDHRGDRIHDDKAVKVERNRGRVRKRAGRGRSR